MKGVKFSRNSTLAPDMDQPKSSREEVLKAYAKLGFGPLPAQTRRVDGRIHQAADALGGHPALHEVMRVAQLSRRCLTLLRPLVAPQVFEQLQPGPLIQGEWCVLTPHPAWSAKLRQSLPAWAAHLRSKGMPVERIRLQTLATSTR